MERYLYSEIAALIAARQNCSKDLEYHRGQNTATAEWFDKHESRILELVKEHMPSGSGFDNGTTIDLDKSHSDKLVFHTSYHHMHDSGMYDGWTEHTIVLTPSFLGHFDMRISGHNRNEIKDYIADTFRIALGIVVNQEMTK
jgi:hypothetical protein